jgi:hypothetical protein
MAGDVAAVREWIKERICETRWLADEARAAAYDIEDQAVLDATVQLANDLEAFAARLATRLIEVGAGEQRGRTPAQAPKPGWRNSARTP